MRHPVSVRLRVKEARLLVQGSLEVEEAFGEGLGERASEGEGGASVEAVCAALEAARDALDEALSELSAAPARRFGAPWVALELERMSREAGPASPPTSA